MDVTKMTTAEAMARRNATKAKMRELSAEDKVLTALLLDRAGSDSVIRDEVGNALGVVKVTERENVISDKVRALLSKGQLEKVTQITARRAALAHRLRIWDERTQLTGLRARRRAPRISLPALVPAANHLAGNRPRSR